MTENAMKVFDLVFPPQYDTPHKCKNECKYEFVYDTRYCSGIPKTPRIKVSELRKLAEEKSVEGYKTMKRAQLLLGLKIKE